MNDTAKLKQIIKNSGLKYGYIAEQLGINAYTFSLKVNNKNEFKTSEVSKLCELLKVDSLELKEQIFFAN